MNNKQKQKPSWAKAVVMLMAVAVVFMLSGCGGTEKPDGKTAAEPTGTAMTATSAPKEKPKPKPTKKPAKKKEKPKETFDPMSVTKGNIEENFDEALKHVTICGKKVSFPLTLNKLGKDFTVKSTAKLEGASDYFGVLYYKGKRVAHITILNGLKTGNLKKKCICDMSFISDITPNLDFDICGVNFNTPIESLLDLWGEASHCPKDDYRTYRKKENDSNLSNCISIMGGPGETVYSINIFYRGGNKNDRK